MQRHQPRPVGDGVVVRDEHPALAGRDRLRRIEREGSDLPEGPGVAAIGATDPAREGVRRVLDDRDAARLEDLHETLDLDRQAGEVDRDHGPRARRHGGEHGLGRRVERPSIDIDEDRPRPAVGDDLGSWPRTSRSAR